MFIIKNKYFFIIENTKDIKISNIKKTRKFNIIYRNNKNNEKISELKKFRNDCKKRGINFFISNDAEIALNLKADGLYISAHNNNLNLSKIKNLNFKIIGSAHNINELNIKKKQGCSEIIFSRLFETSYKYKKGFLGVIRFNLLNLKRDEYLAPLGGITFSNLNKLKMINCDSIVLFSEIKKKPAIFSRLF
tara:strand:- start:937 stop:1509 length:573 start_codon:yes stop_codon:yes gene_type:complete